MLLLVQQAQQRESWQPERSECCIPGVKQSDLSEEQKQTISTLATLSAGMAGGIASGDVAGAAAGAGVGKNIAENNLVGGTESEQSKAAQTHGADVLSCNDAPCGEACKRGEAVNKAYAGALATGSVALLRRCSGHVGSWHRCKCRNWLHGR